MKFYSYLQETGKTEMSFESWAKESTYPTLYTEGFETEAEAKDFASTFPGYTKPNVIKVTSYAEGQEYWKVSFFFSRVTRTTGEINETAHRRARRVFK